MFGFGKKIIVEEVVLPPPTRVSAAIKLLKERFGKQIIVEEIPPPTRLSAPIELLNELVAPIKDYIPSILVENIILISLLVLIYTVYAMLREYPSRDTILVGEECTKEGEEELVATQEDAGLTEKEAVPKEMGDDVVEMSTTSSSSISGLDDDGNDIISISDVEIEDIIEEKLTEDEKSGGRTYNDFLINSVKSEDRAFLAFEAEEFARDGDVLKLPSLTLDELLLDTPVQDAVKEDDVAIAQPSVPVDVSSQEMSTFLKVEKEVFGATLTASDGEASLNPQDGDVSKSPPLPREEVLNAPSQDTSKEDGVAIEEHSFSQFIVLDASFGDIAKKDDGAMEELSSSTDDVLDVPSLSIAKRDEVAIEEPFSSQDEVFDKPSQEVLKQDNVAVGNPMSSIDKVLDASSHEVVEQDEAITENPSRTQDNEAPTEGPPPAQDGVSALDTLSKGSLDSSPSSPKGNCSAFAPSEELSVASASSSSRTTKRERTTIGTRQTQGGANNLEKGKSTMMRKSTSSNSLGNLKRNLSFKKLSSMKKMFK